MDYRSSNYGCTQIVYDEKLLPAADVLARYDRDDKIAQKYDDAVAERDALQMSWGDVAERLSGRADSCDGDADSCRKGAVDVE